MRLGAHARCCDCARALKERTAMKRMIFSILAVTTLVAGLPAIAFAQSEMTINQRQSALDARIDAGVRSRSLTNAEAAQLRSEFQEIARIEAQYRSSGRGLTSNERADLDNRFDLLSRRIRYDRNDNDGRAALQTDGQNINERQRALDDRIDAGIRNGSLTRTEASQLRQEFDGIARQEAQYRSSGRGLTQAERADLDRRFDTLSLRIRDDRRDDDRRWTNLDQRQAQFNERLNRAVSDGRVSRSESARLRAEFDSIARVERQYRRSRPGITDTERADLNARFDRMESNYRVSVNNGRYGNGANQYDNLFDFLVGLTG